VADDAKSAQQIQTALKERGLDPSGLEPVGVRPSLDDYLAQLWDRRHFIWTDARHRVATQNSRNRLGSLWLLLRPMLDALMYFLIFAVVLDVDRGVDNYPAYILIGVLMFRSTMRSISQGPSTLQSGKAMIRAFTFPRAALPLSAEIRDAFQMVYTVPVVLVMIMAIPEHETPEFTWLLIPVIFVLQFFLNVGISLVMARVGFLLPDVTQLMTFVARLLMYTSGVIIPVDRFLDTPVFREFIQVNPIYHMLAIYREALMDGTVASPEHWLILAAWAIGLTLVGFLFFWQGEETYGAEQR